MASLLLRYSWRQVAFFHSALEREAVVADTVASTLAHHGVHITHRRTWTTMYHHGVSEHNFFRQVPPLSCFKVKEG